MVLFEELEHLSNSEWSISTKLKRYTTSETYVLESKGEKSYQTQNINNYMINSNHDCIKDDDGRRVFICDASTKRRDDLKYFGNIRKTCFNDKVGEAFYWYLKEIDVTKFYSQSFPITQSKLDAYAKRLNTAELFLKVEYMALGSQTNQTNLSK